MDERLHAPTAYPIPRPDLSDRTIALGPDGLGGQGRVGRLAAILWQGLRRHARTTAAAPRGVLPKVLERFSAEVVLDLQGRPAFARRDPSGRIEGITWTDADRFGIGMPESAGPAGLALLGDRRAPDRIYVARTVAVALGLYQQDGLPDRALLCGLGDGAEETDSALARLLARHTGATVQVAIDARADAWEGQALEAQVLAALRKVQSPEARVTVSRSVPLKIFPAAGHSRSSDPSWYQKGLKRQREKSRRPVRASRER